MDTWGEGLHQAAGLLIRRGNAMVALLPTLFLCPVFLFSAWLFRSELWLAVPLLASSVGIVFFYMWQYANFAKKSPERLQSEAYRYEVERMHLIASKELPQPVPVDQVGLEPPSFNPEQEMPNIETIESENIRAEGDQQ